MIRITTVLTLLILVSLQYGLSQSDIAIGEWKSHLPYSHARYVTQSEEKIIFGTELSLFTIDKEDQSIEYISKVDGLTETGIQHLDYDPFNNQVIVAYDNSTIDIVSQSEVFPIIDLRENTNFNNRQILDTYVQNAEWMYAATGFGLIQFNLIDREFGFTLDAKQIINNVDGNDDIVLISGEDGVYKLDVLNAVFPNAFSEWEKIENGLPQDYSPLDVLVIGDRSYIVIDNSVFVSNNFTDYVLVYENTDAAFNIRFIKEVPEGWMAGLRGTGFNSKLMVFDNQDTPIDEIGSCVARLRDAEITEDGSVYFADDFDEVRIIDEAGNCMQNIYPGPFNRDASDVSIKDNKVFVASGGVSESFGNNFGRNGIYILEDNEWNNINQDVNPFFRDKDLQMFYQVEAHPSEPIVYIGIFGQGVVEYNYETLEQQLFIDDNTNGALGEQIGNPGAIRITGMTFDDDDNLWVSNFGAANPVAVKSADGPWYNFSVSSDKKVEELIVDDFGYVWVVVAGNTGGVNVIDPGESLADPSDDGPTRFINLNNSEISTGLVNSIAKDLDGAIWVGTAEGVVTFECGSTANESTCLGSKRRVTQDSIVGFLLGSEDVISIEVDGANRKWFGTRNGIFVQDPSGEEEIARFNVENSPLFDNTIKSMRYNPETGEMFIVSNKGIQSIRTETTGAGSRHAAEVIAFPNPVRPEYGGPVAIKGLARDAEVRITDIDGQLVFETDALGGQAIWDTKNLNGNDVAGGVYLVFSSSTGDNFAEPDTYVTKILIVR